MKKKSFSFFLTALSLIFLSRCQPQAEAHERETLSTHEKQLNDLRGRAEKMHLLTIATDENHWLDDWEKSAKIWGYDYTILGKGVTWEGFKTLTTLILNFLESRDPKEIIVIVDSYDLILAGPPDELLAKYQEFKSPLVVGGESVCIFNCHRHSCKVNNEKYKWVNTGFIAGEAAELVKAYQYTLKVSPGDDQIGIAKYMDAYPHKVTVDGDQTIVANIRETKEIGLLENRRFTHQETGSKPVIMHIPFMYSDLGGRSEKIRKHALENYQSPPFLTYTKGFISHAYKHLRKNPAYSSLYYGLCALFALMIGGLAYFLSRKFL